MQIFVLLSGVFSQTSSLDGVYSVSFHLDIFIILKGATLKLQNILPHSN